MDMLTDVPPWAPPAPCAGGSPHAIRRTLVVIAKTGGWGLEQEEEVEESLINENAGAGRETAELVPRLLRFKESRGVFA